MAIRFRAFLWRQFGSTIAEKRADIVVHDPDDHTAAYIIVEVKKPKRKDGLEQLKSYCNAEGAPVAVWTNGGEEVVLHRGERDERQTGCQIRTKM